MLTKILLKVSSLFESDKKTWDYNENKKYFPIIRNEVKKEMMRVMLNYQAPVFIVDSKIIEQQYAQMKNALEKKWGENIIAYSVKTNYPIAKDKTLKDLGSSVDVVSEKEFNLVRKVGYKPNKIFLNGPYKPDTLIKKAVKEGVTIHVYNFEELQKIAAESKKQKKQTHLGIRLSTYVKGVGKSRFGFGIEDGEAADAVSFIESQKYLSLSSIHHHNIADTFHPDSFADSASKVSLFLKQHVQDYKKKIRTIDIGGGFPANRPKPFFRSAWELFPIEKYIEASAKEFNAIFDDQKPKLVVEPGRYIVDDSTFFVCKPYIVSNKNERQIISVDATLHMLPLADYCPQIIYPFYKNMKKKKGKLVETVIYGSTSREDDVIYRGTFPKIDDKVFFVFYSTGAYNYNMSADFIYDIPETIFVR